MESEANRRSASLRPDSIGFATGAAPYVPRTAVLGTLFMPNAMSRHRAPLDRFLANGTVVLRLLEKSHETLSHNPVVREVQARSAPYLLGYFGEIANAKLRYR
jgi:hypothetical protein